MDDRLKGKWFVQAGPSRPYKSLADLIEAAKAKPDSINYGTIGAGSLGHLTMVLLSKQAGVRLPYREGGPAMNDALAGHVDLIIGSAALVSPQLQAGTLRPIVQTGATRHAALLNLPTLSESGFARFESLAGGAWSRRPAPRSRSWTDERALRRGAQRRQEEGRFRNDLAATLREERIAKQLTETQQISLRLEGPEEFCKIFDEQLRFWGSVGARER